MLEVAVDNHEIAVLGTGESQPRCDTECLQIDKV